MEAIQISGTNVAIALDTTEMALGVSYTMTASQCGVEATGVVILSEGM